MRECESMKTCSKCGETKGLSAFYAEKRSCDGLTSSCRVCRCLAVKAYRDQNKTKIRERKRADEKSPAGMARLRRYRQSSKGRATICRAEAKCRANITDGYAKRCLLGSDRSVVGAGDVPFCLVEMKRERLRLHRLAKQLKQAINQRIEHEQG